MFRPPVVQIKRNFKTKTLLDLRIVEFLAVFRIQINLLRTQDQEPNNQDPTVCVLKCVGANNTNISSTVLNSTFLLTNSVFTFKYINIYSMYQYL